MIYLSICIPTFERIEITRKAIQSIYDDTSDVNMDDFEVIISDNSPNHSSKCFESEFKFTNFKYHHTKCDGYLNSFYALNYGSGLYLKLSNNYTTYKKGSLKYLINQIKNSLTEKPVFFHSNGYRYYNTLQSFSEFDDFIYHLSYFTSASTGFGIWKEDLDKLFNNVTLNRMFPQTSLLLKLHYKTRFCLDDNHLFEDLKVPKKGGYNQYYVFGVEYLSLLKNALNSNIISLDTYNRIKSDTLKEYLSVRYLKTAILRLDKFDLTDINKHLSVNYGSLGYVKLIFYTFISLFKIGYRNLFH